MSATGNPDSSGRKLSTADLAAAGRRPVPEAADDDEGLESRAADRPADVVNSDDELDDRAAARTAAGERAVAAAAAASERPAAMSAKQAMVSDRPAPVSERPAAVSDRPAAVSDRPAALSAKPTGSEQLDPLFPPEVARDYRSRWAAVQSSFVDDPRRAVRQGDELVAQMMKNLAESFAGERERLEGQLGQSGEATTETLRVSLRRYRSFFERLLSL